MHFDRHALSLRLRQMEDSELCALHDRLTMVCTGREIGKHPVIAREVRIVETTDCERGALVRSLLGNAPDLSPEWFPNPDEGRIYLNTALHYTSIGAGVAPRYRCADPGLDPVDLDRSTAGELLRSQAETTLIVEAVFTGLQAGWSCLLDPPVRPARVLESLATKRVSQECWLLVCRDADTAKEIFSSPFPNLDVKNPGAGQAVAPVAIVLDEISPNDPEKIEGVFLVSREEAVRMIRNLCDQSDLILAPGREQMIAVALSVFESATEVVKQGRAAVRADANWELTICEAKNQWEKLFIDEKTTARMSLQIDNVAHPVRSTTLVLRGAREAYVARYAFERLIPLVKNFLEAQVIKLKWSALEAQPPEISTRSRAFSSNAAAFRVGVLHALPSLTLLLPSISLTPATIQQAFGEASAPPVSVEGGALDATDQERGGFDAIWQWGAEKLDAVISKSLEPIEAQLEAMNETLGDLFGLLVVGQTATALSAVIATGIAAAQSAKLSEVEKMIEDLLKDVERRWPEIERTMRELLPAFHGTVDKSVVERANRALRTFERI